MPYCDQEIPDGSAECPVCKKNLMEASNETEPNGAAGGENQSGQTEAGSAGEPAELAVAEKKPNKIWMPELLRQPWQWSAAWRSGR